MTEFESPAANELSSANAASQILAAGDPVRRQQSTRRLRYWLLAVLAAELLLLFWLPSPARRTVVEAWPPLQVDIVVAEAPAKPPAPEPTPPANAPEELQEPTAEQPEIPEPELPAPATPRVEAKLPPRPSPTPGLTPAPRPTPQFSRAPLNLDLPKAFNGADAPAWQDDGADPHDTPAFAALKKRAAEERAKRAKNPILQSDPGAPVLMGESQFLEIDGVCYRVQQDDPLTRGYRYYRVFGRCPRPTRVVN